MGGLAVVVVATAVLAAVPLRAEPERLPDAVAETVAVQVLGMVRDPGTYVLPANARLSDALDAGGLHLPSNPFRKVPLSQLGDLTGPCESDQADLHRVYLSRGKDRNRASYAIDLARAPADPRYNVLLRDGDKIYVPECRSLVHLVGAAR